MSDRFESLDGGEVVSVRDDQQVLSGHRTFRVGELSDAIKAQLASAISGWTEEKNGWFSERGIEGEALRFGSNGWQKGRIRLCLEFCPDEPTATDRSASHSTSTATNPPNLESIGQAIPTPVAPPLPSSHSIGANHAATSSPEVTTAVASAVDDAVPLSVPLPSTNLADPIESVTSSIPEITQQPESSSNGISAAAVAAVGVVGTMATAVAATAPAAPTADLPLEEIQLENIQIDSPPLVDTVLEEHHPDLNTHHGVGLEEIAIEFNGNNRDLGVTSLNGMMELDLNDLSMDFSEHDMLSFEANGLSDSTDDFSSFQDDKPENSGMLIDEVWNEMNQGNWPSIN
jgi:KGK domain